ncbi:hypothetical protein [Couchioplanes caeruleus]|uniref:Uncharacterized protein n=2 Tax=Couchioplanes caeruleus TaxID=56438 RepID=A0A1K0FNX6_9ACTN|nr:hypothetical protein [Couchioplanes caeruleus]OJF14543.1 hypothetical protein BG844_09435 [Couchioplanes caeruleus subsp. caeruleus]ROP21296.1 hypothetical protein EDD30_7695 [Couchioplanes caeruleus]
MSAPVADAASSEAVFPAMKRDTLYHGVDLVRRFAAAVEEEWLRRGAQIKKHEVIDALLLLAISNRDQLPAYLEQLRRERREAVQAATLDTVEEGDAR